MNVLVTNRQQGQLSTLDIDIIKSISGTYEANEIVEMFKNFFYSKMILDVTAIRGYDNLDNYHTIVEGLDADKIIFYLPEGSKLCTSTFLSQLISMGIYNFTTNTDGVKYLLKNTNTYKDVAHIQQMASSSSFISNAESTVSTQTTNNRGNGNQNYIPQITTMQPQYYGQLIIGIRNVTPHAGATSFIYMFKKELNNILGDNIVAIEVNKNDFQFFNDPKMISTSAMDLRATIEKFHNASIVIIDLNDLKDDNMCGEILYLLEPTMIKLNRIVRRNRNIFINLKNKKLVLNKSMLGTKDVSDFEYEANMKVYYNMPPLDERKRNQAMTDFIARIGLIRNDSQNSGNGRIFGLFRR